MAIRREVAEALVGAGIVGSDLLANLKDASAIGSLLDALTPASAVGAGEPSSNSALIELASTALSESLRSLHACATEDGIQRVLTAIVRTSAAGHSHQAEYTGLWRMLSLLLAHGCGQATLAGILSRFASTRVRATLQHGSHGILTQDAIVDSQLGPGSTRALLRCLADSFVTTSLPMHSALDLGPSRGCVLLPSFRVWPANGLTVAMWLRLESLPQPAASPMSMGAPPPPGSAAGVPRAGESLLFRARSADGLGMELVVRPDGRLAAWVDADRGMPKEVVPSRGAGGVLPLRRWVWVCAVLSPRPYLSFLAQDRCLLYVDHRCVVDAASKYPPLRDRKIQESAVGGFLGQLGPATAMAAALTSDQVFALRAAMHSPGAMLAAPTETQSQPRPPISSVPTVMHLPVPCSPADAEAVEAALRRTHESARAASKSQQRLEAAKSRLERADAVLLAAKADTGQPRGTGGEATEPSRRAGAAKAAAANLASCKDEVANLHRAACTVAARAVATAEIDGGTPRLPSAATSSFEDGAPSSGITVMAIEVSASGRHMHVMSQPQRVLGQPWASPPGVAEPEVMAIGPPIALAVPGLAARPTDGTSPTPPGAWDTMLFCLDPRRAIVAPEGSSASAHVASVTPVASATLGAAGPALCLVDISPHQCHGLVLGTRPVRFSSLAQASALGSDPTKAFSPLGPTVIRPRSSLDALTAAGGPLLFLPLLSPPSACASQRLRRPTPGPTAMASMPGLAARSPANCPAGLARADSGASGIGFGPTTFARGSLGPSWPTSGLSPTGLPRLVSAPVSSSSLPLVVECMALSCQASARCAALFLRRGGLDAVAHLLRQWPASALSVELWASVARLVSAVAGTCSPELPDEGVSEALPAAPATGPRTKSHCGQGPMLSAVAASPLAARAVRRAQAHPATIFSVPHTSGDNAASGGAAGKAGEERVSHPVLFLAPPLVPAPFGWQVRRASIARLLFDARLWLGARPRHCAAIAARMARFAAANPLAVAASVPVSAVCHAMRVMLWERAEDGARAPAEPRPLTDPQSPVVAAGGECESSAACVLGDSHPSWRRVARAWLWQLVRVLVLHSCGRFPAGSVMVGVQRVSDEESRSRRVQALQASSRAHRHSHATSTAGQGGRARRGSSLTARAGTHMGPSTEAAGSLVLAPAASMAAHAVTCGPIMHLIKASSDPALRLEAACTLLSLLPAPKSAQHNTADCWLGASTSPLRPRSRTASAWDSDSLHLGPAAAGADGATEEASPTAIPVASGFAGLQQARERLAGRIPGQQPGGGEAAARRAPRQSLPGEASGRGVAAAEGCVPLPPGRAVPPPPPICRYALGPWSAVVASHRTPSAVRELVAGAAACVPCAARADPGMVAALRAMGDGAALWTLVDSGDEECVLAGLGLLGRLAAHADVAPHAGGAFASPAGATGGSAGDGLGRGGGGSGAIALHTGLSTLLGSCLSKLPCASVPLYRALMALVLGRDPWAAAQAARRALTRRDAEPPLEPGEITQPALIPCLFALARRAGVAVRMLLLSDLLVLIGGRPGEQPLPCVGFGDVIARGNRARLRRAKRWPEGLCAMAIDAEIAGAAALADGGSTRRRSAGVGGRETAAVDEAAARAAVLWVANGVAAVSVRVQAALQLSQCPEVCRNAAADALVASVADSSSPHALVQASMRTIGSAFPEAAPACIAAAASAVLALLCEGGVQDTDAIHAWLCLLTVRQTASDAAGERSTAAATAAADEDTTDASAADYLARPQPVAIAEPHLEVLGGPSVAIGLTLAKAGRAGTDGDELTPAGMHACPAALLPDAAVAVLARVHCRLVQGYCDVLEGSSAERSGTLWDSAAREAAAASDLVVGVTASPGVALIAAAIVRRAVDDHTGAGAAPADVVDDLADAVATDPLGTACRWRLGGAAAPLWTLGEASISLWSQMSASLSGWSDLGLETAATRNELAAAEAARSLMSRARVQALLAAVSDLPPSSIVERADEELSTTLRSMRVLLLPAEDIFSRFTVPRRSGATPQKTSESASASPGNRRSFVQWRAGIELEPPSASPSGKRARPFNLPLAGITSAASAAAATADASACERVRECRSVAPGGAVLGFCASGLAMATALTAGAVAAAQAVCRAEQSLPLASCAAKAAADVSTCLLRVSRIVDTVRAMTFTLRPRATQAAIASTSAADAAGAAVAAEAIVAVASDSHLAPVLAGMFLSTAKQLYQLTVVLWEAVGETSDSRVTETGAQRPGQATSLAAMPDEASLASEEEQEQEHDDDDDDGDDCVIAVQSLLRIANSCASSANRVLEAVRDAEQSLHATQPAPKSVASSAGVASGAAEAEDVAVVDESQLPLVLRADLGKHGAAAVGLVDAALERLERAPLSGQSIGEWLEACAVHRARLAGSVGEAEEQAAVSATLGAQENAEALTMTAEAMVAHVSVFSEEEEAARQQRAAQRRSRVWADHSRRTAQALAELGRAAPWGPLGCADDVVPETVLTVGGSPESAGSGSGTGDATVVVARLRPLAPTWLLRCANGSIGGQWVPDPVAPGDAAGAASLLAVDMSAAETEDDDDHHDRELADEDALEREAGVLAVGAAAATTKEDLEVVAQDGEAREVATEHVAGPDEAAADDRATETLAEGGGSNDDEGKAVGDEPIAAASGPEGDWELVDITRATGDGPALYAAPCSLVLPHAIVEGRMDISQNFVRFFPDRLAGEDAAGVLGLDSTSKPFGASDEPVAWVPDAEATACLGCGEAISGSFFISGKHHCRRCGGVFCASCSTQRRPLPSMSYFEPVRVCDACAAAEDASKLSAVAAGASPPPRHQPLRSPSTPTGLSPEQAAGASAGGGEARPGMRASGLAARAASPGTVSTRWSPDESAAEERAGAVRRVLATVRMRELVIRSIPLADITAVYGRRFLLRPLALEVFLSGGRPSLFFAFPRPGEQERVAAKIWGLRSRRVSTSLELTYPAGVPPGTGSPATAFANALALGYGPGSLGPQAGSVTMGFDGNTGDRASLGAANSSPAGAGVSSIGSVSGADVGSVNVVAHRRPFETVLAPKDLVRLLGWTEAWRRRVLSNFDYLCCLNFAAGRTRSDPSQYPVFPWVVADYTSEELDFQHPKPGTFRDLSKPVGALTEERLDKFRARMEAFMDPDEETPPFLYGSHYSNMGSVSFFLIRTEPFTSMHLSLQRGRFDHADRLFHSVGEAWSNVLDSQADVKELVPEFFSDPSFLRNDRGLALGTRQSGVALGDVELPPWAKGSPELFVQLQREALECEHVSQRLHQWVELIFGHKQRGEEAIKADNLFFHLTYEGAMDSIDLSDAAAREAAEAQVAHFGQTPSQLFTTPHPPRLTQEEAVMAEWGPIIASAMLARRHSARRTLLRSPHRGPVTSLLLPQTYAGLVSVDAWGVAATAAFGATAAAAASEQPWALGYRDDAYTAVVAPEWIAARALSVQLSPGGQSSRGGRGLLSGLAAQLADGSAESATTLPAAPRLRVAAPFAGLSRGLCQRAQARLGLASPSAAVLPLVLDAAAQSGGIGGFGPNARPGEDGGGLGSGAAAPVPAKAPSKDAASAAARVPGTTSGSSLGDLATGEETERSLAWLESTTEASEALLELNSRGPTVALLPSGGLLLRGCGPGGGAEIVRVPGRVDVVGGAFAGSASAGAGPNTSYTVASTVTGTLPFASWAITGPRPTPFGQAAAATTSPSRCESASAGSILGAASASFSSEARRGSRGGMPVAAAAAAQTLRPLPRASVVERMAPVPAAVISLCVSEDGVFAALGHADGSLGLWLISTAVGGHAGEGANGCQPGAGLRGLGMGLEAMERERQESSEAAVAAVLAGSADDVALEAALLASAADASQEAGGVGGPAAEVAAVTATARATASAVATRASQAVAALRSGFDAAGAARAYAAGSSGTTGTADTAIASLAMARPVASGGWSAAGWLLAADGASSAIPIETGVTAVAASAGSAYGGPGLGASRGCPAVSADASLPVAALVSTSLAGIGVCLGAGEGARGAQARLTADLDAMTALRTTVASRTRRGGTTAGSRQRMLVPALEAVSTLLGMQSNMQRRQSRRPKASSQSTSRKAGMAAAVGLPGKGAEGKGEAWEVVEVEEAKWSEAAEAQEAALAAQEEREAIMAAEEAKRDASLSDRERREREAAAARARAAQRARRATAARQARQAVVSAVTAAARGAGSSLGRNLVRIIAGSGVAADLGGMAGLGPAEAAAAHEAELSSLLGLGTRAGGEAGGRGLGSEDAGAAVIAAAETAEQSEMAIPLGFFGLHGAAGALGSASLWLAPPGSSAGAAFRGLSASQGGCLLLGGGGGTGPAGGAGGAVGSSGGGGAASGSGHAGGRSAAEELGGGGGSAGGSAVARTLAQRVAGRGSGGSGIGGLGSNRMVTAGAGGGFRTVYDVLAPLLSAVVVYGGEESHAALQAAVQAKTPRPLPSLLGPPQTAVWAADARDLIGCRPLIEPPEMLRPLCGAVRRAVFDAAVRSPVVQDDAAVAPATANTADAAAAAAAASDTGSIGIAMSDVPAALEAAREGEVSGGRFWRREVGVKRATAHCLPAGRPDTMEPWLPLFGHTHAITCISVNTVTARVASGDAGGVLAVHCIRTGRLAWTQIPSLEVRRRPASTSTGGDARVSAAREDQSELIVPCPIQQVIATASGRVLVSHGRSISCFGPTGALISTTRVDATVVALLASATGRFLVCATRARIFVLYTATLQEVKTIDALPPAAVRSLTVHPSGRAIVAGFDRGLVGIYATDLTFYAAL